MNLSFVFSRDVSLGSLWCDLCRLTLLSFSLLILHITSRSMSFMVTRSKCRFDLFWVFFSLCLPTSQFVRLLSLVDNYPKMFREQNYANASTWNTLYCNISDVDISGLGRNSDSDMGTFWNCDVKRYETQTGHIKTPLPPPPSLTGPQLWIRTFRLCACI